MAVRTLSVFLYLVVAPSLLIMCAFSNDRWVIFALLCGTTFLTGFNTTGIGPAYLDVVPRFSGFVNTIANTLAAVAGILGPVVGSAFLVEHGDVQGWNYLFVLTIILTTGFLVWVLFCGGGSQ